MCIKNCRCSLDGSFFFLFFLLQLFFLLLVAGCWLSSLRLFLVVFVVCLCYCCCCCCCLCSRELVVVAQCVRSEVEDGEGSEIKISVGFGLS